MAARGVGEQTAAQVRDAGKAGFLKAPNGPKRFRADATGDDVARRTIEFVQASIELRCRNS